MYTMVTLVHDTVIYLKFATRILSIAIRHTHTLEEPYLECLKVRFVCLFIYSFIYFVFDKSRFLGQIFEKSISN